jgi:hypothetical protein
MAVFSILVTYQDVAGGSRATPLTLLMPLAIMGVPLFDTLSVIFIRWRAGKPLMVGDRNHFSHRLVAMGFGVRGAAATIALLTAATGLLALGAGIDACGGIGDVVRRDRGAGGDGEARGITVIVDTLLRRPFELDSQLTFVSLRLRAPRNPQAVFGQCPWIAACL